MTIYRISAGITEKSGNCYKTQALPVFFLSSDESGIKNVQEAVRIAGKIINDNRFAILARNTETGNIAMRKQNKQLTKETNESNASSCHKSENTI